MLWRKFVTVVCPYCGSVKVIKYGTSKGRQRYLWFIQKVRYIEKEQRRRLIDCFVNAVYLYEDRVVLTFNYEDGGKTVTLKEVEGSDLFVLSAYKKARP